MSHEDLKEMFKYFPKEIFKNRKMCDTPNEFWTTFANESKHQKKTYFSLYDCPNKTFKFANIHMVAFDIDNNKKLKNTIKIHKDLTKANIRHCLIFSTNGFWVYAQTKNYENLNYPKDALTNVHNHLAEYFNMKWGKAHDEDADLDIAIRGDVRRIGRMLGSYDYDRERYCISVTPEDLEKGMEHIIQKSKKSSLELNWYCDDKVDISKFDNKISKTNMMEGIFNDGIEGEFDYDFNEDEVPSMIKYFPPFVQNWVMQEGGTSWEQRYWFTVFLTELGLPDDIVENMCRYFFIKQPRTDHFRTNYHHWKAVKCLSQAHKEDMNFPRIEYFYSVNLIQGATLKDYEMYNDIYYKSYDMREIKNSYNSVVKT